MDAKLHAVDADTGKPCAGFASGGILDVNQWNKTDNKWPLSLLQPPTVYKDTLFIGWAGKDWAYEEAPPGTVFAVDARTGALKWTFHTLPDEVVKSTGTANIWASMSVDVQNGILYLPVSSPSPNYFGGNRTENADMDVIRTGGPAVTDDVLGELVVSTRVLGTTEIMLLDHTGCGFTTFTDDELNEKLIASTGNSKPAPMRFFSYEDPEEHTKEQIAKIRSHTLGSQKKFPSAVSSLTSRLVALGKL